jgi:hypothetical protein
METSESKIIRQINHTEYRYTSPAKDTLWEPSEAFGVLPYIREVICLPNGEHYQNDHHGYHGYQPVEKSMRLARDDGYHVSGASGTSKWCLTFSDQTEFGLHLDSRRHIFQGWTPVRLHILR